MPVDPISEERLKLVHPALAAKIRQMAVILDQENIRFRVTQGLRTWAEQDKLYALGRTTPGAIVTNAKGGESWHNYALAVDLVPFGIDTNQPDWDETHRVWQRLIQVGDSLGLQHVNIKSRKGTHRDWPHFQLTGRFPASPDDEVRQIFRDAGTQALWIETFRDAPIPPTETSPASLDS